MISVPSSTKTFAIAWTFIDCIDAYTEVDLPAWEALSNTSIIIPLLVANLITFKFELLNWFIIAQSEGASRVKFIIL